MPHIQKVTTEPPPVMGVRTTDQTMSRDMTASIIAIEIAAVLLRHGYSEAEARFLSHIVPCWGERDTQDALAWIVAEKLLQDDYGTDRKLRDTEHRLQSAYLTKAIYCVPLMRAFYERTLDRRLVEQAAADYLTYKAAVIAKRTEWNERKWS